MAVRRSQEETRSELCETSRMTNALQARGHPGAQNTTPHRPPGTALLVRPLQRSGPVCKRSHHHHPQPLPRLLLLPIGATTAAIAAAAAAAATRRQQLPATCIALCNVGGHGLAAAGAGAGAGATCAGRRRRRRAALALRRHQLVRQQPVRQEVDLRSVGMGGMDGESQLIWVQSVWWDKHVART